MKDLTSTASNVAIAASGLVGLAGIADAQQEIDGSIVSYVGAPVTALAASNQDLIFDLATDTVITVTGANDNLGNAQSFDLEARATGNENFFNDTENHGGSGGAVLVIGGSTKYLTPDLAAGTPIGTQESTSMPSESIGDDFFTGKNYAALNITGDTSSQFPDDKSNPGSNVTTTGYLGFEFVDPNIATQTDYGWAEVTVDPAGDITLDGFAYDDSGDGIFGDFYAGTGEPLDAPEPAVPGMVLLGGAALAFLARRSRKLGMRA
jgi:hypothetical protein